METITVFKTIKISGKDLGQLQKEVSKDFQLGDYAKSMKFTPSKETKEVSFCKKSLKEYGFTGTTFSEMLDFFRNHPFYEICQPEDAYYLRMAYTDQPKGEWVRLAMDTIPDSDGYPDVFHLVHDDDGLWLLSDWCNPGYEVGHDDLWFARLRKTRSQNSDTQPSSTISLSPSADYIEILEWVAGRDNIKKSELVAKLKEIFSK
jgi:hypothetical protein